MQDRNLDLGIYSEIFSAYRHRITQSRALEEATLHAAAFLDQVEGMFDGDITIAFYAEVEYLWAIFPAHKRTLEKYKELLEVLLGQAVDFYWYAQYPQYHSYQDVKNDPHLCSFRRFDEDFDVKFMYVQYYRHVLMRVPNSLRLRYRRLVNHPGKYTQGLMTTRCKPAMVGLINRISEDVESAIRPRKSFKILVNSILRTVEYQHSLAKIGYVAPRNSGHLAGYAVDVEKIWYQENDQRAHAAIEEILDDLYASGVVNLIREGTHWHICLHPDHIQYYEALSQKWVRNNW
jgi:hypothetical protein